MKKFISLAICLLMVFALSVPAFAAAGEDLEVRSDTTISGNVEYNTITMYAGALTVDNNACLKAQKINKFPMGTGGNITVKSGATVTTGYLKIDSNTLTIESGATVIIGEGFDSGFYDCTHVDIAGMFRGNLTQVKHVPKYTTMHPGGLFDISFKESGDAENWANVLSAYNVNRIGNRVIAHYDANNYENGVCTICYHECDNVFHADECPECGMIRNETPAVGSALSEGNMIIICTIAAAVVFGLGGFILGTKKKKKPALASGENTDEE